MQETKDIIRTPADRRVLWLIILITLLGFAVRVINLSGDSFWFDELLTYNAARLPIDAILAERATDRPPGYYALEHYAEQWWGSNEFGVRLTSALAGTLTIPLMFVAASVIARRRVGLWVALLLAVSPFHIRYSQEARGYAIQTMLAVAGLACMLLALKQRQWRWWLGFGLVSALNLYNLFGAFLVIGSQVAFVLALMLVQVLRRKWTRRMISFALGGLLVAGVLTLMLYGPYLGAALQGVQANIGPEARQSSWYGLPLVDWIVSAQQAFAYNQDALVVGLSAMALAGLVISVVRCNVEAVLWLIIGSLSPLLAITLLGVSRAPLPKYVLFVLPVFLLAVAIALDELLAQITARVKWPPVRYAPLAAGLCLVILSLPAVAAEHAYVYQDWKDILANVQRAGSEGDVFVPITLDLPDNFNEGIAGLEYYLPQYFSQYLLLPGEHLAETDANAIDRAAQSNGNVWVTLYQRSHPVQLSDPRIQVTPFQTSFYLIHPPNTDRSALEELADLYPQIITQANTPAPQCYLWIDLARIYVRLDQYDKAHQALTQMPGPCPGSLGMRQSVNHLLLGGDLQIGQVDQARAVAMQLLLWDAKDAAALQALTLYDLSALYTAQANGTRASSAPDMAATQAETQDLVGALVSVQPSPAKPIEIQRFTMPNTGDWGDALVMQTPARVSYRLQLPNESTMFVSRIAMAPESWEWGGDGARFQIRVTEASGQESIVFDQLVSNQPADQTWHDVRVPLAAYTGKPITLTLETDPGPQGDTTGDWAGWETPRIIYAAPTAGQP